MCTGSEWLKIKANNKDNFYVYFFSQISYTKAVVAFCMEKSILDVCTQNRGSMFQIVIIINGSGGVGKDTLCSFASKKFKAANISAITPIKEIARYYGWNGEKDSKSRKFLADLKKTFIEYNDLPFQYLMTEYKRFLHSSDEILFVHIREGEEIDKFRNYVKMPCVTLLIRRNSVKSWGNPSDDDIENYNYDYIYDNNEPLTAAEEDFCVFLQKIMWNSRHAACIYRNRGGKQMKIYVNAITGIDDAIVSMYMSHRSWTRELELHIYDVCRKVLNPNGSLKEYSEDLHEEFEEFRSWLARLLKWGWKHTTMLRFIDFTVTVEGLHRAGQDDWDAHAKRFDNRIIRNSTRTKFSDFQYEMSSYYQEKIMPTDVAAQMLDISLPETIIHDGKTYVKAINGYVLEEYKDNPDVKRGLYMLSIPSNFIFKVNLTEWAHVYKLRNAKSSANPEVRQCCEMIADQLAEFHKEFDRELFDKILN